MYIYQQELINQNALKQYLVIVTDNGTHNLSSYRRIIYKPSVTGTDTSVNQLPVAYAGPNQIVTDADEVIISVNDMSSAEEDVWLEAECGTVGSLWNINSDVTASNDKYITIKPGNNSTDNAPSIDNGQISYIFNLNIF